MEDLDSDSLVSRAYSLNTKLYCCSGVNKLSTVFSPGVLFIVHAFVLYELFAFFKYCFKNKKYVKKINLFKIGIIPFYSSAGIGDRQNHSLK